MWNPKIKAINITQVRGRREELEVEPITSV